jgi:hypothetical protein
MGRSRLPSVIIIYWTFLYAGTVPDILYLLCHLKSTASQRGMCYLYAHFRDQETQAQKS